MLEQINSPKDIKEYSIAQLEDLAQELRDTIITTVSKNGGHLSSNLGVVELTLAIHHVFDCPDDNIIFDVGHQCYAHKLLTGRYNDFHTLRQADGLSGYTNKKESPYDTFYAGHSGASLSAALGVATANLMDGNEKYVVAVIGDGSFTNGMIYEALNGCQKENLRLVLILNDNEMSISPNVGGFSQYLSSVRTSRRYFWFKHTLHNIFGKIPVLGRGFLALFKFVKNFFKRLLAPKTIFEDLGIDYIGPIDGNDIKKLEVVLKEAKARNKCCLVHIKTKKGKGYPMAEQSPDKYHSVCGFDILNGITKDESESFSTVFGDIVCKEAQINKDICAITAAMCYGTGLKRFYKEYRDRFFDVGIAEEHAVTFAGGLAAQGKKPVCAIYSTFAQRAYDQLFHDVALQEVPIILALDRAGLVIEDGRTHQGIFDCALFSSIPNIEIYSPENYNEMRKVFKKAFISPLTTIVRYPKGAEIDYDRSIFINEETFSYTNDGESDFDAVIITYGRITYNAVKAIQLLQNKKIRIIKLNKIHPLELSDILPLIGDTKLIYFLEEGIKSGGIAEKFTSRYCEINSESKARIVIRAINNKFIEHGDLDSLFEACGFKEEQIAEEIDRYINASSPLYISDY